jgi:hypothetical protein
MTTIPVVEESLVGAIVTLFPDAAEAITESDAFGVLGYKVNGRCRDTSATPLEILNSIEPNDRAFGVNTTADLAAFLASRIDL